MTTVNQFGITSTEVEGETFISLNDLVGNLAITLGETVRMAQAGTLSKENATGVINALTTIVMMTTGQVPADVQAAIEVNALFRELGIDSL